MKKVIKKVCLGTFVVIFVVVFGNFIRVKIIENRMQDNYRKIVELHKGEKYELVGFPVLGQKYFYSCNISTICSVNEFYGETIDEDSFMKKYGIKLDMLGMSPEDVNKYFNLSLVNQEVIMETNIKDSEVVNIIINQLRNNIPVPIFYSTIDITNMTRFGTHYSTIIGIDMDKNKVKIANVYGYLEETTIEQLLDQLKHRDKIMETDWWIKLAKGLGIIRNNTSNRSRIRPRDLWN
jgi:hypothetical protein